MADDLPAGLYDVQEPSCSTGMQSEGLVLLHSGAVNNNPSRPEVVEVGSECCPAVIFSFSCLNVLIIFGFF